MFERRAGREEQSELWVVRSEIAAPKAAGFYRKLNDTLRESRFAEEVWKLCAPHYAEAAQGGRPGIDPVIYFKMLMVGFFEDLPSQRAIAARCDDSRAIREFLGYDLTEATPLAEQLHGHPPAAAARDHRGGAWRGLARAA